MILASGCCQPMPSQVILAGVVMHLGREKFCHCQLAAAFPKVMFVRPSRHIDSNGLARGVLCCGSREVLLDTAYQLCECEPDLFAVIHVFGLPCCSSQLRIRYALVLRSQCAALGGATCGGCMQCCHAVVLTATLDQGKLLTAAGVSCTADLPVSFSTSCTAVSMACTEAERRKVLMQAMGSSWATACPFETWTCLPPTSGPTMVA